MADPMITAPPLPPAFLRLRARQTSATPQCSLCTTTALSLAKCTSDYDPLCSCSTTLYNSYLSSCMFTQLSLGCTRSDWTDAVSSISESCSYWTSSLASSICTSCATFAATAVTCADISDFPCLCRAPPTTAPYLLALNSCATPVYTTSGATFSCDFTSQTALTDSLVSSCSSYSSSTSAYPPGCPDCQAQAADQVSCSGRLDWKCLCTTAVGYLPALSLCISQGTCANSDYTIARSTYTDACSVIATGGTFVLSTASATGGFVASTASATGGFVASTDANGVAETGVSATKHPAKGGPGIVMVAGVVVGVLLLLALLCVGGFFLFRRKKDKKQKEGAIPLTDTATNGSPPDYKDIHAHGPQEVDGVAIQGHPGQQRPVQQQGMWPAPAGYAEAPSPAVSPAPHQMGGWGQPQAGYGYVAPPPPALGGGQGAYVELGLNEEAERRKRADGGKAYFELPGH